MTSDVGAPTARDTTLVPPRGGDPWRRSRKLWRVVGSIVAVVMLLGGLARVVGVLAQRNEPVDELVDAAGIEQLRVELPDSDLELVGADVEDISVTGSVTSGLRRSDFRVEPRDGQVFVTMSCARGPSFHECAADLRIVVPRGLDVSVDMPNSEVTLRDLAGRVDARSSNSSMSASALDGPVRLRATNGSVTAKGLRSSDVDVVTSNDDVELEFLDAPRSVVVTTSNASSTIVVPDTADFYDLQLTTSNGATSAEVRSDPDSDRVVRVSTSNDDILVRYPE